MDKVIALSFLLFCFYKLEADDSSHLSYATDCLNDSYVLLNKDAESQNWGFIYAKEAERVFSTIEKPDSLFIQSKLLLSKYFLLQNDTLSAQQIQSNLEKWAINQYKKDKLNLARVYQKIAAISLKTDHSFKALSYVEKGLKLLSNKNEDLHTYALLMAAKGSILLTNDSEYSNKEIKNIVEQSLAAFESCKTKDNAEIISRNIDMGILCFAMNDLKNATFHFQKAYDESIIHLPNDVATQMTTLNNLAAAYATNGDFVRARNAFEKVLSKSSSAQNYNIDNVWNAHFNIGSVLIDEKKYSETINYYHRNLQLFNSTNDETQIALAFIKMGKCFIELNQNDSSLIYLNKALAISKQNQLYDIQGDAYYHLALLKSNKGNLNESQQLLLKGLDIIKNEDYLNVNDFYNLLSENYAKMGVFDQSLAYADEGFESTFGFPYAEEAVSIDSVFDGLNLIKTLNTRAKIHVLKYEKNKQVADLETANKIYGEAIDILQAQRQRFLEIESKLSLRELGQPIYEQGIFTALKLSKLKNDDKMVQQALIWSEESKNNTLKDAIRSANALENTDIPKKISDLEYNYRTTINELELDLKDAINNTADAIEIATIRSELFDIKEKRNNLLKEIEKKYPSYYDLKYEKNSFDINFWKSKLTKENKTLVEFFAGEDNVFVFVLNNNNLSASIIPNTNDFNEKVETFLNSIKQYHGALHNNDLAELNNLNETYNELGLSLNQIIFQPILPKLSKNILVVTDGILSNLPFEALLYEKPKNLNDFRNYPYLLNKHKFSYTYSALLLLDVEKWKKNRTTGTGFAAFAPAFESPKTITLRDSVLIGSLIYNIEESNIVMNMVKGDVFSKEKASLEKFKSIANQYQILHLSTHALVNNDNSNYSFLAFSSSNYTTQNPNYDLLYAQELYNMKLNSDMIVLSACQTGVGKIKLGEGALSLARGFSFAGVASIIQSLWSISDSKTALLMQYFYQNLINHQPKDEALHQAKLKFIKKVKKADAHPFYWAAMIPTGDMEAINFKHSIFYKWKFGLLLLLPLSFLAFRMKKYYYQKN